MEHAVLDRFLRPFAECLTPEVAQRIVDLELDPHSQAVLKLLPIVMRPSNIFLLRAFVSTAE